MDESMLPSPPPKPDFTHRIKLKHQYSELKSRFYEMKNRSGLLKGELSEKETKENEIRAECDLILDQIELIRTRMPSLPSHSPSTEEEPIAKRIKRYQLHDPTLPFLFDSSSEAEEPELEEADGDGETEEESEEVPSEMESVSVGSLTTETILAPESQPTRPTFDADAEGEDDEDDEEEDEDEEDEDAEGEDTDEEEADES